MQAARALLSHPMGLTSPEQAGGLLELWVAAWAAASQGTLAMPGRVVVVRGAQQPRPEAVPPEALDEGRAEVRPADGAAKAGVRGFDQP